MNAFEKYLKLYYIMYYKMQLNNVPMRTVRLTKEQEEKLTAIARQKQVSRSQIIKEALEQYMEQEASLNNPYKMGASLFGRHGSGESDRSVTYKERLAKKIRKKWPG